MKIIRRVAMSKIEFTDESEDLKDTVNQNIHSYLGVKIDGIEFSKAYKMGHIDGLKAFYNMKTGEFATGLIDQVEECVKKLQRRYASLEVELVDEYPERWIEDSEFPDSIVLPDDKLGQIELRDYQYRSVKQAILQQMGIIHVATNGGKCMTPDTMLSTNHGLLTVEQLFQREGLELTSKEQVVEYRGTTTLTNRYGEQERPSHLTFNGEREIFKVTTSRGYTEKSTSNHPYLVVSPDGTFDWVNTEDLKEGMWIVSRKGDNVYGTNDIQEDEARLLGMVVADAYIGQDSKIAFTNDQDELIAYAVEQFKKLGHTVVDHYGNRKGKEVRLSDAKATREYHKKFSLDYSVASGKSVPPTILGASKEAQLAFLSGYLECEMSLEVPKCAIEVSSASHKLLQQVQVMLLNMGYVSNLSEKVVKGYEHNKYFRLTLGAVHSHDLLEELTFLTAQRQRQVVKFNDAFNSRKRNDKSSTVPYGKELVEAYKDSYPNPPKGMKKKMTVPRTISATRLRDLVSEYPNGDVEQYRMMMNLLSTDFSYSQVVSVEPAGTVPTFDVAMPDTHSFIGNGMVNHNTEIGSGIIQQLLPQMQDGERVVFLVPTKEIFYGAKERLEQRLGMEVGVMGDGKRDLKQVNVVLMPSLVSALKDPSKEVKVTAKERVPQIIVQELLPKFKGKANVKALLKNYMRTYVANTKAREQIKDALTELAHSDLSDAQVRKAMNNYEVQYTKAMEKKAGAKWAKYQDTLDFVESVVCVICDETHRAKGDTWFDTISKFTKAQYRVGMTGTIDYKDQMLWQKLQGLFGQVVERVANEELIGKGFSAKPFIKFINIKEPTDLVYERDYQTVYTKGIVENDHRNLVIAMMCKTVYEDNKTSLIIVNRLDHGERIFELLKQHGVEAEFINGELDSDIRKRQLEDVKSGKLRVLIATTVLDEGVDISGIHCLILGAGGKSLRQTLQRVGRILRRKEDDNRAIVIDFYDRTNKYLLGHSKERHAIYDEEGFDVKFMN